MTTKTIQILEKLIAYDTTSERSNAELIKYIEAYLLNLGIESELIKDPTKNKFNLFATIGPTDVPGIILSGHTDTVPVTGQNWDTNPYELMQKNQRLYGRGTADMKGFIASVLAAVPSMLESPLKTPLHLAFSYDEEVGCLGVRHLLNFLKKQSIRPLACIIGEPTSMEIVTAHKGKIAAKVKVLGKECHSGMAPYGVNAINYAARLISMLEALGKDRKEHGPFDHRYEIPYTTIHTGKVSGGTALNIVPKLCEFEFEVRHIADDKIKTIMDEIYAYSSKLVAEMKAHNEDCDIHIEIISEYPGLDTRLDSSIIEFIKKITQKNNTETINFGTEGGLFSSALDIPSIVYGPGSMQQGHKPNEYIEIEQISLCDEFLIKLINELRAS